MQNTPNIAWGNTRYRVFIFFNSINFGFSCQIKNEVEKRKKTKRNDRIRHENRKDEMGENIIGGLQYYFQPKSFKFLIAHIEPLKKKGVKLENNRVCFLVLKWPYLAIFKTAKMAKKMRSSHMQNSDDYRGGKFETTVILK